jgi:hypothetical protein
MVILFTALTYGLVVTKVFTYCCGECHQELVSSLQKENDSCCGNATSCCGLSDISCCESDGEGEPVGHDCTDEPCRSEFVQFDWSPVMEFKSVTPVPPVLDLFYENHLLTNFVLHLPESEVSKVLSPPIVQPPPREYLSLLNVLII